MARRRFQDPEPFRSGSWWYILVWCDRLVEGRLKRQRERVKLGPATLPEREARKIAAEVLRPLNQGLITVGSAVSLGEFVDGVYIPTVTPLFARSTRERYKGIIGNYLKPAFGDLCLREITPLAAQRFFSGLDSPRLKSFESRDKIRDVLSSILGAAVKYGFLVTNPVEGVRLPPASTGRRAKPYVTPEQFDALVAEIREPYASMLFVAVNTGLRVSELIGLRWQNVHADSITIDERCSRGDWGRPKSEASNATIPVNREVIERIHRLKLLTVEVKAGRAVRRYPAVKADGANDLVFQSPVKGVPMRDNNILVRHIKPAARRVGIPWANWLVLRRSFATWLKMVGADVRDAQSLMRHSRASTTLDIYQQPVRESERRVIDDLGRLTAPALVN